MISPWMYAPWYGCIPCSGVGKVIIELVSASYRQAHQTLKRKYFKMSSHLLVAYSWAKSCCYCCCCCCCCCWCYYFDYYYYSLPMCSVCIYIYILYIYYRIILQTTSSIWVIFNSIFMSLDYLGLHHHQHLQMVIKNSFQMNQIFISFHLCCKMANWFVQIQQQCWIDAGTGTDNVHGTWCGHAIIWVFGHFSTWF